MDRRQFVGGFATATLSAKAISAKAQDNTIRIIYPFAAGGGGDAVCRILADEMRVLLGRNVIVENRTGANGLIGIKSVMNAAPDGLNILVTTGPTIYLLPLVENTPSFDPRVQFTPVSILGRFEFAIIAGNNLGINSFSDLITWLKANPEKASFGVPSFGTIPHFAGVQLSKLTGVKMTGVPYRGGVPLMNDLVGGHIPFGITAMGDVVALHQSEKIKVIAVPSEKNSPFMPEVPTLTQSGVNLVADSWYGMWLPAKTPATIVAPISKAVMAALAKPEIRERIMRAGTIPAGTAPDAVLSDIDASQKLWKPIVEETGFKI